MASVGSCRTIREIIFSSGRHLEVLELIRSRQLPDCWVAGGFIRDLVWDASFETLDTGPVGDIDVLYFCPASLDSARDRQLSYEFSAATGRSVEVKNQARMHVKNSDDPYSSTYHALSRWTESCTSVGVRLEGSKLTIIAPHGTDDLIKGYVRPTSQEPWVLRLVARRIVEKGWLRRWRGLSVDDSLRPLLGSYLRALSWVQ